MTRKRTFGTSPSRSPDIQLPSTIPPTLTTDMPVDKYVSEHRRLRILKDAATEAAKAHKRPDEHPHLRNRRVGRLRQQRDVGEQRLHADGIGRDEDAGGGEGDPAAALQAQAQALAGLRRRHRPHPPQQVRLPREQPPRGQVQAQCDEERPVFEGQVGVRRRVVEQQREV